MTLKEMVGCLRFTHKIEIRDESGDTICECYSDSPVIQLYGDYEVYSWFTFSCICSNDFCVYIKDSAERKEE